MAGGIAGSGNGKRKFNCLLKKNNYGQYTQIAKILLSSGMLGSGGTIAVLLLNAVKLGSEKIAEKIIRNNLIIDFNHPCGYCEKSECYTYPVSLIPGYCYCPGCECLHPREDSASPSGSLMLNY